MIALVLVVFIILWFLRYIHVSGLPTLPNFPLFTINGRVITLWDLLILIVIGWAIGILPSPLRQIAGVILLIWILATLGVISIMGLPSILVLAVIIGLILALLGVA